MYENNERVTLIGKSPFGRVMMSIVGALNVGSINLEFDSELRTNVFNKE